MLNKQQVENVLREFQLPTEVADFLIKEGFNKVSYLAHTISQMMHETGNFRRLNENLNYSEQGLLNTFPTRVNREQAKRLARNPEAIANHVYGNRYGNNEKGDGYKYRGRGYIQITFKDNYRFVSNLSGYDLVNNPDLLERDKKISFKVSVLWLKSKNILKTIDDAPTNNVAVEEVTRIINGGTNGLKDRKDKFVMVLNKIKYIV